MWTTRAVPAQDQDAITHPLPRSHTDREHKGCMVVNSALELAPHDGAFREFVAEALTGIESCFLACVKKGARRADDWVFAAGCRIGAHLLGVLMGARVLARDRPGRPLLEGVIDAALLSLDGPETSSPSQPAGPIVATAPCAP
jgi:TetR/AcrR family transcriptional repressor of nem operon